LGTTIREVKETTAQINAGSQAQSSAATSTAAGMEEISVSTTQIADLARETNTLAEHDLELSNNGRDIAEKTAQDMARVADLVAHSAQAVMQLNEKSEHIGSIVMVIREIADKTNLLALNAVSRRHVPANRAVALQWWQMRCASWPSVPARQPPRFRN
jgi:methyl-accepting chemotaxis protein